MSDDAFFPDFTVSWDEITQGEAAAFENALNAARDEGDMQRFLESHPRMLVQHLTEHRRAWVIPQRRLGAEHVTDFMIAERVSGRYSWHAVELERPQAKLFNKKGDPSAALTHALRQISDWRTWLSRNRDYASRPIERSGLGLTDIEPDLEGLIIMGRESDVDPQTADLRRSLSRNYRIRIETYDWLLSVARDRLAALERAGNRHLGAALFNSAFSPQPEKPAERAVREIFGGVFSTTSRVSAVREIDWEGVDLDPDYPDLVAALQILHSHGTSEDGVLQLPDWEDWTDHVARDIDTDLSLLITENTPSDSLQSALTLEQEGVWYVSQFSHWRGRVDVLVHLPLTISDEARNDRVAVARKVLLRHIPAPAREDTSSPDIQMISLAPGDAVTHEKFGAGSVVSTTGSGAQAEAIIDFGAELGTKHLVLRYATLTKP